jgi:hypothetical protein
LNVESIIEFLKSKDAANPETTHNLMIFGDIDARKHARKLANEIGVDFEETGSYLSDNSNKSKDNKWHMNDNVVMSKNIFKELTDL